MSEDRFQIGDWWIDQEPGSDSWYRYRYDPVSRRVSRKSLRCTDKEAAKLKLAAWITETAKPKGEPAGDFFLAQILEAYFLSVTDKKPSKKSRDIARSAGSHAITFFGDTAKVGEITEGRQKEFWHHCASKLDHSVDYISRNMSVVSTAINHSGVVGAPTIVYGKKIIAEELNRPDPGPREYIPTPKQVGQMFDSIPKGKTGENLFRHMIIMLTTAARPEASLDLGPAQVRSNVVDLNPKGRRQNKKFRATVVAGDCLFGWLHTWEARGSNEKGAQRWDQARGTYIHRDGHQVKSMKGQVKRLAIRAKVNVTIEKNKFGEKIEVTPMSQYALRHFIGTELAKRRVPKEERDFFMAHKQPGAEMTAWYEKFDPSYLANAVAAIDDLMREIQAHCTRNLFSSESNVVALKPLSKGAKIA